MLRNCNIYEYVAYIYVYTNKYRIYPASSERRRERFCEDLNEKVYHAILRNKSKSTLFIKGRERKNSYAVECARVKVLAIFFRSNGGI